MTNANGGDRLDQVEAILVRAAQQQETNTREANVRMVALEQLAQSNSRAIQALLDSMVDARKACEELRQAIIRITELTEGINLTVSLDDNRPTILGRLSRIKNKVD